jgi:hypothetical protein
MLQMLAALNNCQAMGAFLTCFEWSTEVQLYKRMVPGKTPIDHSHPGGCGNLLMVLRGENCILHRVSSLTSEAKLTWS